MSKQHHTEAVQQVTEMQSWSDEQFAAYQGDIEELRQRILAPYHRAVEAYRRRHPDEVA